MVNQVQREFNGLGQLITEYQAHGAAVDVMTTPKVQYEYSEMSGGANHSRLTSMTYPNGRVITSDYGSGLNDTISRLNSLKDGSTTLEGYSYLGLGAVVERLHPESGIDLSYVKKPAESVGDAGDQYTGLDRFGRVVDQRWLETSSGTAVDEYQYGYDRDSNRTYRDNRVATSFGEVYSYDGLNQLVDTERGTLNGTKTGVTGTPSLEQSWNYDALGNWDSVTTNGTTQTRSHNQQNEITGVSGATTPTYDANGNMTTDETGKQFVYDAWNFLKAVKNSGGTTLETFSYDALKRKIQIVGGDTVDLYYSAAWQVIEERESGLAVVSYVWSPVYVDAMISRDRDTDNNGTLDERLYVLHDANFNVTGLVNTSGTVLERFTYEPFGKVEIRDASWAIKSGGTGYSWLYLHQGGRFDSVSGLYAFRMREYSPTLGRWMTNDPIGYAADLNTYASVRNAPTQFNDPQGLAPSLSANTTFFRTGMYGAFSWAIKWQVTQDVDECNICGKGGIILQRIDVFNITSTKGGTKAPLRIRPYGSTSSLLIANLHYWEAWNVDASGKVTPEFNASPTIGGLYASNSQYRFGPTTPIPMNIPANDLFQMMGDIGTVGTYTINSRAYFIQGAKESNLLNIHFRRGNTVTGAGGLPSLPVDTPRKGAKSSGNAAKVNSYLRYQGICVSNVYTRIVHVSWQAGGTMKVKSIDNNEFPAI